MSAELARFFESQVSMKASRKLAKVGMEVRCSKTYLQKMFSLLYKGYDVYDQIIFRDDGTGTIKFASLPKVLTKELRPMVTDMDFQYSISLLNISITFNSPVVALAKAVEEGLKEYDEDKETKEEDDDEIDIDSLNID